MKQREAPATVRATAELRQRVSSAVNKLADRDTHQIAVDELERIAASLSPATAASFLASLSDHSDHHRTAVRKECVRITASLAAPLLAPHLHRVVPTILRRLKDPEPAVRDACVDAAGALCAAVGGDAAASLALPLFEALREQNRYLQAGAALCLSRIVGETASTAGSSGLPVTLLQQMLTRVMKLIKNQQFLAKPALIDLIGSIIQAGGALTEHALSSAVTAILDALRSSDWNTRKAASVALSNMAVSSGPLLGFMKGTCIHSLESCRFDKVKPVRDSIMHAIQCWKSHPGLDSPKPSEAGSSTNKENVFEEYADVTSMSGGKWRDITFRKGFPVSDLGGNTAGSTKKRTPLTALKTCTNYVQRFEHPNPDDWNMETSVPVYHSTPLFDRSHEQSEERCMHQNLRRQTAEESTNPNIMYDRDLIIAKAEGSSFSDLISGGFETKHVTTDRTIHQKGYIENVGMDQRHARKADSGGCRYQECKSEGASVTDLNSQTTHECCASSAYELTFIGKHLLEIEAKQSHLFDLLQVFIRNSTDSLSAVELKVHKLQHTIDTMTEGIHQSTVASRLLKSNHSVSSSPWLSTCTPRPSVDFNYRHSSSFSSKSLETSVENVSSNGTLTMSEQEGLDIYRNSTSTISKNPITKRNSSRSSELGGKIKRESKDACSLPPSNVNCKRVNLEGRSGFWKLIQGYLNAGDLESAYAKILKCGDDLGLIQLMDKTGPVLERLSHETADEILSSMAVHFSNKRFLDCLIPWLQQVVDLSTCHEGSHRFWLMKGQPKFISAVQEAAALEIPDRANAMSIAHLASKLAQTWNEPHFREGPGIAVQQRDKNMICSIKL